MEFHHFLLFRVLLPRRIEYHDTEPGVFSEWPSYVGSPLVLTLKVSLHVCSSPPLSGFCNDSSERLPSIVLVFTTIYMTLRFAVLQVMVSYLVFLHRALPHLYFSYFRISGTKEFSLTCLPGMVGVPRILGLRYRSLLTLPVICRIYLGPIRQFITI